jgi:hypothetical protein
MDEHAEVVAFVDGLASRGKPLSLGPRGGIRAPGAEPHEKAFIRAHRPAVLAELRRPSRASSRPGRSRAEWSATRAPEPEPVVYAWRGRRVTNDDVVSCLTGLGDQALFDYRSGELRKSEAFEMTRVWLRARAELRCW